MVAKVFRVSEVYLSIQGEGPNVGMPTVFVRFGGCNLRCPLWPCDTQFAIDPKYRDEWEKLTVEQVIDRIDAASDGFQWVNVCLTGGEPFLQPNDLLRELVDYLQIHPRVATVECFSNGTLHYPEWVAGRINFVMDWKLSGSGEYDTGQEVRLTNLEMLTVGDSVKFTIAGPGDYLQARAIEAAYIQNHKGELEIFAGVVWGKLTNEELVKWMLEDKLDWRLNVQVHNHVWDRNKRGI